jgi:hypothetical protein
MWIDRPEHLKAGPESSWMSARARTFLGQRQVELPAWRRATAAMAEMTKSLSEQLERAAAVG